MPETEPPVPCAAGRTAFFGGRWTVPCYELVVHGIAHDLGDPIWLCDRHFKQVDAAGLVSEPRIGKAAFVRFEARRLGGDTEPAT